MHYNVLLSWKASSQLQVIAN